MTQVCSQMVGVPCGVCGQESFQVAPREAVLSDTVRVTVQCCPRCVRRVDADNEERDAQVAVGDGTKQERRQVLKEESFRWADKWHGRHVLVRYDVSDGYGNQFAGFPKHCQIKGTAYRIKNACGGWGRLAVVLDGDEIWRVTHGHHAKYDWQAHDRLDGLDWSPALRREKAAKESYSFEISWGERDGNMLEEVV